MRGAGCLLGPLLVLVAVAAIGLFIYRSALIGPDQEPIAPEQQIDTIGVRTDLLAIAHAEQTFLVTHGRYGTLKELLQAGAIRFSGEDRHGYKYSAELDGDSGFRVTARPISPVRSDWPVLWVDETLEVVEE